MSDREETVEGLEEVSKEISDEDVKETTTSEEMTDPQEERTEEETAAHDAEEDSREAESEEDDDYDEEKVEEMFEEEEDIQIFYEDDFEDHSDDELSDDEDILEQIEGSPKLQEHRKKKKAGLIVAGIFGVLIVAYLAVALFFNSHFFIGTTINGTKFSGKSIKQVESFMEKQVAGYELTLEESDGGTEVIKGTDIDVNYVKSDDLKKAKKQQNPLLWVSFLWERPQIETKIGVQHDKEKLNEVIAALQCVVPEGQVESVSATPEFKDNTFVIKEEVIGTQIDQEKFLNVVETAISGFQPTVDLKKEQAYIKPRFTKDSKEVIAAKDAMNKYLGASITYDFNPHTEVVDAGVISQWVTVNGDMNVTFNEEAVRGFIQSLSDKYDTYGKNRTMTTGYGNAVEVVGGSYGWLMDKDTEYQQLTANIQNAETVTREPAYSMRAVTHEGNDFGNTYVEIDLTNQHFWFFQNGQLVVESDIVTGNPNKGWDTPQGTYSLAYKQTDQVLRGKKMPDGSYEYESPVSFWMPFNGGIGLHDASWQPAFGGSRYLSYGSRGCINLPYDAASALYNGISAGTPVICHF